MRKEREEMSKKRNADVTCIPLRKFVASSGIEPESGASEALILSIVLRGQAKKSRTQKTNHTDS